MDFSTLADHLRSQSRIFLPGWLPGGKPRGREYVCASLRGGNGDSFSVNMDTGAWADFAVPGVTGGDLISLYAAINNIRQKEAFEKLSESYMPSLVVPKKETPKIEVSIVPADQKLPEMRHPELGIPSAYWKYKDKLGNVLFYVARYNDPICGKCGTKGVEKVCVKCGTKQSKITMPWSWVS